jgi:myo-inositol-1(or 4)-monophosphatase
MREAQLKLALDAASEAALEAGALMRERFDTRLNIQEKGHLDLVTDVDLKAQEIIFRRLHSRFPEFGFLGEESNFGAGCSADVPCWVVDPLDGTTNYAYHIPNFAVSIGLFEGDEPLVGAIYDPIRDHLFAAASGMGLFLNHRPYKPLPPHPFDRAVVGIELARDRNLRLQIVRFADAVTQKIATVRLLGCTAIGIAYSAFGWLDGYVSFSLHPWDGAAGAVMVREAGRAALNMEGSPWKLHDSTFLSGPEGIAAGLLSLLAG